MEVKIKDKDGYVEADWTIEDGILVVSPKEAKLDVTKFKDGDIITCGHDDPSFTWTCILRGRIEFICDNMFIADYCFYHNDSDYSCKQGDSDSATFVRFATEDEKKKLFDKLAEEGYEWKAETKELVKLKWMPNYASLYYRPAIRKAKIVVSGDTWAENDLDKCYYDKGWVFKTYEECDAFCDKLRQAIEGVKP